MFKPNSIQFKKWNCRMDVSTYVNNGRLALMLLSNKDGYPVATATVNLKADLEAPDHIFVKSWSENEGMAKCLEEHGIAIHTGHTSSTGYVKADVMKLTTDFKLWLDEHNTSKAIAKVIRQW